MLTVCQWVFTVALSILFLSRTQGKTNEKERRTRVMTQSEPTLPSNRAFVVQFRVTKGAAQIPPTGRVEHVVSGQATHFQSWEHLQRFVEKVLAEIQAEPP
jgi:hypothetical protein